MATDRKTAVPQQDSYQDPLGCIPRIFWMMMGPVGLVLTAAAVLKSKGWTIADAGLWLVVALTIAARAVDVLRFKGQTTEGEPATVADLRRYVLLVLITGAALWVLARALGPGFE